MQPSLEVPRVVSVVLNEKLKQEIVIDIVLHQIPKEIKVQVKKGAPPLDANEANLPGDPCFPGIPFIPGTPSRPSMPSLPTLMNTNTASQQLQVFSTIFRSEERIL